MSDKMTELVNRLDTMRPLIQEHCSTAVLQEFDDIKDNLVPQLPDPTKFQKECLLVMPEEEEGYEYKWDHQFISLTEARQWEYYSVAGQAWKQCYNPIWFALARRPVAPVWKVGDGFELSDGSFCMLLPQQENDNSWSAVRLHDGYTDRWHKAGLKRIPNAKLLTLAAERAKEQS